MHSGLAVRLSDEVGVPGLVHRLVGLVAFRPWDHVGESSLLVFFGRYGELVVDGDVLGADSDGLNDVVDKLDSLLGA